MTDFPDTTQWVHAASEGNATAWGILYQQYYPRLYAIALRICGNTPAARDAVQETFITAYLKLAQLKNNKAFDAWIKKIVIHHCYKTFRTPAPENFVANVHDAYEDEINRKLDAIATAGSLYKVIEDLPEVLRSTLLLRYFSSFQSYQQIANVLSIPVGTVRSRLNEAKQKMTEAWKQFTDTDLKGFGEGERWNHFYHTVLTGVHKQDDCKHQFMQHLNSDIKVISIPNQTGQGRNLIERLIAEDRSAGSWFMPFHVHSCGNITVAEVRHFNSAENPHHCPESSVLVLHRNGGKLAKMYLHISPQ